MRNVSRQRGFTLVEILIVVTLIGILATLALPAFQRVTLRTRGTAFLNDGRVFSEAFIRYAQEHGEFPRNQRNRREDFPPDMEGYISRAVWTRTTPLGGFYSWDDYRGASRAGHSGAIMVLKSTMSIGDMRLLDTWLDDGDIRTGVLQVRAGGATIYYIIEES